MSFTWIPLYSEIARRVLAFQNRQNELLGLIGKLRAEGLKVIQLNDRDANGKELPLAEIDPFTFFASFNRTPSVSGRQAIVAKIKDAWQLAAPVPDDFDGIPIANAQNSWAFAYLADRTPNDLPTLWRAAREAVEKNWQTFDRTLFDEALAVSQMGLAKLSVSLFWLNPQGFLPCDKYTSAFFKGRGIVWESKTAAGYFGWLEKAVASAGTNFPQISLEAYQADAGAEAETSESEATALVLSEDSATRRYWTLSAGTGGEHWEEFYRNGIAAIGWDGTPDLSQLTKEEIRKKILELWPGESAKTNDALTCWQFAHAIKRGDIIFAKQGSAKLLGCGVVEGDYQYAPTRPKFRHVRKVKWLAKGKWEMPDNNKMALKTLTDITAYPDFVRLIAGKVGLRLRPDGDTATTGSVRAGVAYWWLNANPKTWDFRNAAIGSLETYTSHNKDGNRRQKYKHFAAVQPGDLLVGYITNPDKEIVAVCEVTKALHETAEGEAIEFRKIEEFKEPVTWAELQSVPALAHCEPLISNQGSLFALTADEYDTIRAIIDERNAASQISEPAAFTKADALKDLFMEGPQLDVILARLERKKALILQGPPGVGKTFIARRLAFALMEKRDQRRVTVVQFHPSYGYEDFVQGYRPTRTGGLARRDGVFYEFARLARNDPKRKWFFIIDEINRGNLPKILGELLMLIEADKRGPDNAIRLTYSEQADETFYLSENLHIIGTMNTADRSLAMVDYALRRRFAFVTLDPALDSPAFGKWWLTELRAPPALLERIRDRVGKLNAEIEKERDLGSRFRIGHSFFCPPPGRAPDDAWYREVIASEIQPLLEEYFDSRDRVDKLVAELLS